MYMISDFSSLEKLLLPPGCTFSHDAKAVINCWESKDILACPGSGKTTVLIGKLKILTDRLPLPNGQGICVLSHTNVAVNEIKNKFGGSAYKLLSYPNFIGTIQSFIDKYILFPFLRYRIPNPIQLTSDEDYAQCLYNTIRKKYPDTYNSLIIKCRHSQKYNKVVDIVKDIAFDSEGNILIESSSSKKIYKKDTIHAQNLNNAKQSLFNDGVIRYRDTYIYTEEIIKENGILLRDILSRRFAFVFIDEYQDCSSIQRQIFEQLFSNTKTIFQKIGDTNQTIYSDGKKDDPYWEASPNHLSIAHTHRFSQEIANLVTQVQPEQKILSIRGHCSIRPTLLVYEDISKVLPSFLEAIKNNNLIKKDGIYKAIGTYKSVKGLKISDYWPQFKEINKLAFENSYQYYIVNIMNELHSGRAYMVEKLVRKLICKMLHFTNRRYNNDKYHTTKTLKRFLEETCEQEYRTYIFNLITLNTITYENIKEKIDKIIFYILGDNIFQEIPNFFIEKNIIDNPVATNNVYESEEYGIKIQFDTVHGVKGETHDATLYLETETQKRSDIIRTIKLLNKQDQYKSSLYKKDRNCVYVGFSRPRDLLCLAIRHSTYKTYKDFFSEWDIKHIG